MATIVQATTAETPTSAMSCARERPSSRGELAHARVEVHRLGDPAQRELKRRDVRERVGGLGAAPLRELIELVTRDEAGRAPTV